VAAAAAAAAAVLGGGKGIVRRVAALSLGSVAALWPLRFREEVESARHQPAASLIACAVGADMTCMRRAEIFEEGPVLLLAVEMEA
jgi:hypothetical protein